VLLSDSHTTCHTSAFQIQAPTGPFFGTQAEAQDTDNF